LGRFTVYNSIQSPEKLAACNKDNINLGNEFLEYLKSIDRAETTIIQYANDLKIFWCWNYEFNNNKDFIKITKRNFAAFQNHCLNVWGWSPKRIRRVKSTISSLSNFIENILDEEEEFEGYKSVVRKIESPANEFVREKTVFKEEELTALLDHLVEKEEYMKACVLALCMYSGRRKAEIPRFKVSYFEDKNVMFDGAMFKTDEKVRTKGRGRGKYLNLYVLRKPFLPYLDLWMKEREKLGIDSEWLFPRKDFKGNWITDEQMTTDMMDGWVSSFSDFLGKPFYYHSTRHFFCTSLSENNIPANVIKEIFGWSSVELVSLYTDSDTDDEIGKYFGAEGIKKVEQGSISSL